MYNLKYLVNSYEFITKYLVHGISRPLVERSNGTNYYGTCSTWCTISSNWSILTSLLKKYLVHAISLPLVERSNGTNYYGTGQVPRMYNLKYLVNSYEFITKYLVHGISRPLVERSNGTNYYETSTLKNSYGTCSTWCTISCTWSILTSLLTKYLVRGISWPVVERSNGTNYYGTSSTYVQSQVLGQFLRVYFKVLSSWNFSTAGRGL